MLSSCRNKHMWMCILILLPFLTLPVLCFSLLMLCPGVLAAPPRNFWESLHLHCPRAPCNAPSVLDVPSGKSFYWEHWTSFGSESTTCPRCKGRESEWLQIVCELYMTARQSTPHSVRCEAAPSGVSTFLHCLWSAFTLADDEMGSKWSSFI